MDRTFRDLEHEGWMEKAGAYDEMFALITRQAISPMLDTFAPLTGRRFLDIGCGTGHLAAEAAIRGAQSEGIDFARAMVATASKNYPQVLFREGDAENLPHGNEEFDAVVCSFGIHHLTNPERGASEAYRVLKPGGRFTFTVWASPEQGHKFMAVVFGAVQKHGTMEVDLPPAPPIFRFTDAKETQSFLAEASFEPPSIEILPVVWKAKRAEDVLDLIYRSIVRLPMILNAQTESARENIHATIIEQFRRFKSEDGIEVPFPAVMISAGKPVG